MKLELHEIFGCTIDQFDNIARKIGDFFVVESDEMDAYEGYENVILYREDEHLLIGTTLDPPPEFVIIKQDTIELVHDRENHPDKLFMFFIRPDEIFGFGAITLLQDRMSTDILQFSVSSTKLPHFNLTEPNSNFRSSAFRYNKPQEIFYKKEDVLVDVPMYDKQELAHAIRTLAGHTVDSFQPVPGEGYVASKNLKQLEDLREEVKKLKK